MFKLNYIQNYSFSHSLTIFSEKTSKITDRKKEIIMVSFLTRHLFLLGEIHRNKKKKRFLVEIKNEEIWHLFSFGSHSAHFVQFFNVIIRHIQCVLQCKIPEHLFNCVFLPKNLGLVFRKGILAIFSYFWINIDWTQRFFFLYRIINKNNLHKYLGTEKNEPVTCLSDLLNIKQIVKIYKRVSNIFEE